MTDREPGDSVIPETGQRAGEMGSLQRVNMELEVRGSTPVVLPVLRAHGRETLGRTYEHTLSLATSGSTWEIDDYLGTSASLRVTRGDAVHTVHGIIRRVEDLGVIANKACTRVHLVPAAWALGLRTNHRIYQRKTPVEIVAALLREGVGPWNRSVRVECKRNYPELEICVQYGETDLDFAHRLAEDYGFSYRFDQGESTETIVLLDDVSGWQVHAPPGGGPWRVRGPEADVEQSESIRHFNAESELCSDRYTGRDFDWTRPARDLTVPVPPVGGSGREVYEYPARFALHTYSQALAAYQGDDGADRARARQERLRVEASRVRGESNLTGLAAGQLVQIEGFDRDAADGRYLVTTVESFGHAPEELTADALHAGLVHDQREQWRNAFECVRVGIPWRPPTATRRPVIPGPQTATVVGPVGEAIYTDEHGRIKVQFHWDREGRRDARSSCWIRVAQVLAGNGWGFEFIPRVGMEVVVQFLEGDPDRPVVTACVYNGENQSPYPQPSNRTKSTIRTRSTPDSVGGNELSFEDSAGGECVYLHAQRDLEEDVGHDHVTSVTGDRRGRVGGSETTEVARNRDATVLGTDTTRVAGDYELHVSGDVGISLYASKNINLVAVESIRLECGPTVLVLTRAGARLVSPNIDLTADQALTAVGGVIKLNC